MDFLEVVEEGASREAILVSSLTIFKKSIQ